MRRRRVPFDQTARGEWQRRREELIRQAIRTGLGMRPAEWWRYDSGRPELEPGTDEPDAYVHLGGPFLARARCRLAWLAASRELTAGERRAIAGGTGPAYQWRRDVLAATREGEADG